MESLVYSVLVEGLQVKEVIYLLSMIHTQDEKMQKVKQ